MPCVDPWLLVLLLCAATFRLSWLLTVDEFPPVLVLREWVAERYGEASALGYLSTCLWCTSVWLGGVLVAGTVLAGVPVPVPVLVWLTTSAFTGVLGTLLG